MNKLFDDITFLTWEQLFGEKKLDIIKKIGRRMVATDFAILLGADTKYEYGGVSSGYYFTSTMENEKKILVVGPNDTFAVIPINYRLITARPVLLFSGNINSTLPNIEDNKNDILKIEYGEYPTWSVDKNLNAQLEILYLENKLETTNKIYTTNIIDTNPYSNSFILMEHNEFAYNGKKYIRVINVHDDIEKVLLTRNIRLDKIINEPVWIEVQPIKWIVDQKAKMLIPEHGLITGIPFNDKAYDGNLKNTLIYQFIINHFIKEIEPIQNNKKAKTLCKSRK